MNREAVAVCVDPTLDYNPTAAPAIRDQLGRMLKSIGVAGSTPLAGLVRPNDTVLIKPNLVLERVSDARSALTNAAVIGAVVDAVLQALDGRGRVVIADVPLQSADFDAVIRLNGLDERMEEYRRQGAPVELLDLRKERLIIERGIHRGLKQLPGDPLGYEVVNLGDSSELASIGSSRSRFAVGDYDRDSTARYHMSSDRNEYLIPRTVLAADVVINVPKMKTHKKSGITCALKNLVGICGHKSYLPHFRLGLPRDGGDEFAVNQPIKEIQRDVVDRLKTSNLVLYRSVRAMGRALMRVVMAREDPELRHVLAGSWFGNDTLWRTILDLNKVLRYADASGTLHHSPQRRYLCIVDGIHSGEGDGPFAVLPRHDGVLLAGTNPVLVDLVVCLLMGFDPDAIPQVCRAFGIERLPLVAEGGQVVRSHLRDFVVSDVWPLPNLHYRLPPAWEGYVQRREESRWEPHVAPQGDGPSR